MTSHPPKREEQKSGGFFDYGAEVDEREEEDIDELQLNAEELVFIESIRRDEILQHSVKQGTEVSHLLKEKDTRILQLSQIARGIKPSAQFAEVLACSSEQRYMDIDKFEDEEMTKAQYLMA